MSAISIHEVLAQMADAGDRPFKVEFVRSTGKQAGSVKECFAYYGAPNPKERGRTAGAVGVNRKVRKRHVESGTVPLTEVSTRNLITPLISHIIGFNGKKVYH
jgi:hypothetical protein